MDRVVELKSCKYLFEKILIIPGGIEIGSPNTPQSQNSPSGCLGRNQGFVGGIKRCDETAENDPCW